MSYRDETETLRARVEALEAENAQLRGTRTRPAEVETSGALGFFLGAPTELMIKRQISAQTDDDTLRMIGRLLSSRFGPGEVKVTAGTLSYRQSGHAVDLVLVPDGDGCYLQLNSDKTVWAGVPWALTFAVIIGYAMLGPLRPHVTWWMWPIPVVVSLVVTRLTVGPHLRRHIARCARNVDAFTDIIEKRPRA